MHASCCGFIPAPRTQVTLRLHHPFPPSGSARYKGMPMTLRETNLVSLVVSQAVLLFLCIHSFIAKLQVSLFCLQSGLSPVHSLQEIPTEHSFLTNITNKMFRFNISSLILGLLLAVLASALPHKRQGMADEAFHVCHLSPLSIPT